MGGLKNTLANKKDTASSSSQKSVEVESQLRVQLQTVQDDATVKQSIQAQEKRSRTVAVRKLNQRLREVEAD